MMSNAADLLQILSAKSCVCLGTRAPIELRSQGTNNDSHPFSGMVATFFAQENNIPYLLILLNHGNCTFHGRIRPSEATKVAWKKHQVSSTTNDESKDDVSDEQKVKILSNFLLEDMDRIGVSYDYTTTSDDDDDDKQQVKLVIRQQMSTTDMTRFLWSSLLEPLNNDATNLFFARILGTMVNRNNNDIQTLQTRQDNLRVDLLNWKDTAEKLDRDWQSEKDGLLHNFLKLYKKAHEQLGESRQEVSSLKRALAEARATAAVAASTNTTKKRSRSPPPTYAALPDDVDHNHFDMEMVDMLAAGQKTSTFKQDTNRSSKKSSKKTLGMRKNPHTGAKEVWDTDAFIRDFETSQDEAATAARTSTTSKRDGKNKKDSTETNEDDVMADATTGSSNETKKKDVSHDPMAIASALFATKENKKDNSGHSTKPPTAKRVKKKADSKDDEKDNVMAMASKHFGGTEV